MKKLMFAILAISVMASCKKEKSATPVPVTVMPAEKKVAQVQNNYTDGSVGSVKYTYDATGRLSIVETTNDKETFNYQSAAKLVVARRKLTDNSLLLTIECTLNDKGAITKMEYKNLLGVVTYVYEFTYNADGYIVKNKYYIPNGSIKENVNEIVDDNVVAVQRFFDGVQTSTRQYSYDANVPNTVCASSDAIWNTSGLFGKNLKNAVKEFKEFDMNNAVTYHWKNSYEHDAKGYIIKQTTNYLLTGQTGSAVFTYLP